MRGLVEGFYGRPYGEEGRARLISALSPLPSATYLYAPKCDPCHRLRWRAPCGEGERAALARSMRRAAGVGVSFIFGVSPWGFEPGRSDAARLREKLSRALDDGAAGLALLFDDVPERADARLARAQLELADEATRGLGCPVVLCPSVYCLELMESLRGSAYLEAWRADCPERFDVMWTGDGVVSRELGPPQVSAGAGLLGREPVLWDNLLADDYALRRIYLGSPAGRVGSSGRGYLLNPSEVLPVAVHAVAEMLGAEGLEPTWPEDIGPESAWEVLSGFHHLPWSTAPPASGLLDGLRRLPPDGGVDAGELRRQALGMADRLDPLVDRLPGIRGGFDLLPYVMDLRKMLRWTAGALDAGSDGFDAELRRAALGRLPWEHPLALLVTKRTLGTERGEGP